MSVDKKESINVKTIKVRLVLYFSLIPGKPTYRFNQNPPPRSLMDSAKLRQSYMHVYCMTTFFYINLYKPL